MKLNFFTKRSLCWIFFSLSIFCNSMYIKNRITDQVKIFDNNYSFFLQDSSKVSHSLLQEVFASKYNSYFTAVIKKPIFVINKNDKVIYLSKDCEEIINITESDKIGLIELNCNNLELLPKIYKQLKHLNIIKMNFINNRRWQIIIEKYNKLITIDFPAGEIDVENFKNLDNKYNLTKNFKTVDLRFQNKIGIQN